MTGLLLTTPALRATPPGEGNWQSQNDITPEQIAEITRRVLERLGK